MKIKSYTKNVFLFSFFLMSAAMATNFFVDPEKIYPDIFPKNEPVLVDFSKELSLSKYGILNKFNKLNERDRKRALAVFSNGADCAIIGSSHVLQISSFRSDKSLIKNCTSIINLGVSGGTLEDYFAFSNMLLENKNPVRTIVFGIDPWSLRYNSDARWNKVKSDFDKMINKLSIAQKYPDNSYTFSLFLNLINLEYLLKSIDSLAAKKYFYKKEGERERESFQHAKKFDFNKGVNGASITLPDGSHIYENEYIIKSKSFSDEFDGLHDYKITQINGMWYNDEAISDFKNLIKLLKSKFNILLVMTPYHPKVWQQEQPVVEAMKSVEDKIHMLSNQLNITVIGSYDPIKIGCSEADFFDAMHPTDKCLKKLERKITENQ